MKHITRPEQSLDGVDLLKQMTPADRHALAERASWRRYGPGETIIHYLDTSADVFFVVAGRVRALNYSRAGRQVSYRDIDAGEMFGEFAAIDGEPRSSSVIALSPCVIATLAADGLWRLLREQPSVVAALLRHFTRLLRLYSERVKELATLPVSVRVQVELLRLALPKAGDGSDALIIEPAPTHAEIADRIGTNREAVTRVLSELRRNGVLQSRRGTMTIVKANALRQAVSHAVDD